MRNSVKWFVLGILFTIILGTTVMANQTRSIEVNFGGIRIMVNNQLFIPQDAEGNIIEPFIWNGVTYLPVRAVSEALGVDVRWSNNTVYIGCSQASPQTSTHV